MDLCKSARPGPPRAAPPLPGLLRGVLHADVREQAGQQRPVHAVRQLAGDPGGVGERQAGAGGGKGNETKGKK